MTPAKYQMILPYRFMIPLFLEDARYPLYSSHMDVFEEHDVICQKKSGLSIVMTWSTMCCVIYYGGQGFQLRMRSRSIFLTPSREVRSTFRPTDVFVYSWNAGKHTCVDLGGSPLNGLGNGFL